MAPCHSYIKDLLAPCEPSCCLLSSSNALLHAPTARLVSKGDEWALSVPASSSGTPCRWIFGQMTQQIFFKTLLENHLYPVFITSFFVWSIALILLFLYFFYPHNALDLAACGVAQ